VWRLWDGVLMQTTLEWYFLVEPQRNTPWENHGSRLEKSPVQMDQLHHWSIQFSDMIKEQQWINCVGHFVDPHESWQHCFY